MTDFDSIEWQWPAYLVNNLEVAAALCRAFDLGVDWKTCEEHNADLEFSSCGRCGDLTPEWHPGCGDPAP